MIAGSSKETRSRLCSTFSKNNNEDPGGTAPNWDRCLVMELREPWNKDINRSRFFPAAINGLIARADARGDKIRLQCVVRDSEYSVEGHVRLMLFSKPAGMSKAYHKEEFLVPVESLGNFVGVLLEKPELKDVLDEHRCDTSGIRDILVCTHGAHDTCCATFGYPVYEELRKRITSVSNESLRVWRVSHIGGHRFSPNLVDLPTGRNWVRMGVDDLEPILLKKQPVDKLRSFYRGWMLLDSLYAQLVERELFMQYGWDWVQRAASSKVTQYEDGKTVNVVLEVSDGSSEQKIEVFEATVEPIGSIPRVDCPSTGVYGAVTQFLVTSLARKE